MRILILYKTWMKLEDTLIEIKLIMEKTKVIYVWDIKLSNAKKLKDLQDGIAIRPGELFTWL